MKVIPTTPEDIRLCKALYGPSRPTLSDVLFDEHKSAQLTRNTEAQHKASLLSPGRVLRAFAPVFFFLVVATFLTFITASAVTVWHAAKEQQNRTPVENGK